VLSQYVEERYARDLLAANTSRVGYLLKDRVADVGEFIGAIVRVADGGTALDPEIVSWLLAASGRDVELAALTETEREIVALIAGGRSDSAIARILDISAAVVQKHVTDALCKLGLSSSAADDRVLAVLRYLRS
jgi:DNA-binding NarL/FixJ family response regulator